MKKKILVLVIASVLVGVFFAVYDGDRKYETKRSSFPKCAETYPNGECMPEGKCMTPTDGVADCKQLYPNYPDKN